MRLSRSFVLFMTVGGAAALLNVAVRAAVSRIAPFEIAVLTAFPFALTFAFVLNRALVFNKRTDLPWHIQYGRFLLVNLATLVQVWIVSVGLVRFAFPALEFHWHAETTGHLIGVLSPILSSYFLHKHFSFASASDTNPVLSGRGADQHRE